MDQQLNMPDSCNSIDERGHLKALPRGTSPFLVYSLCRVCIHCLSLEMTYPGWETDWETCCTSDPCSWRWSIQALPPISNKIKANKTTSPPRCGTYHALVKYQNYRKNFHAAMIRGIQHDTTLIIAFSVQFILLESTVPKCAILKASFVSLYSK